MSIKTIKVLTENNIQKNELLDLYGTYVSVYPNIVAVVEASFQAASDYSSFTGETRSAEEMGWWGYKHREEKTCLIIAISCVWGILRGC